MVVCVTVTFMKRRPILLADVKVVGKNKHTLRSCLLYNQRFCQIFLTILSTSPTPIRPDFYDLAASFILKITYFKILKHLKTFDFSLNVELS